MCPIVLGMNRKRRRKCRCCGELYTPDRRNAGHQRYCARPTCREVSRHVSQQRWQSKTVNRDYHGKRDHCARVRAWRQAHPGYWRKRGVALQDLFPSQAVDAARVVFGLNAALPELPAPSGLVLSSSSVPQCPDSEQVKPCAALTTDMAQDLPLQDLYLSQDPLFVGLIAILTDALQEDMAPVMARLQTRGRAILRNGSGIVPKGV